MTQYSVLKPKAYLKEFSFNPTPFPFSYLLFLCDSHRVHFLIQVVISG